MHDSDQKKLRITNKQTVIMGIICLFISLLLHEITLYPLQNGPDVIRVTILRLLLLIAPAFLGHKIIKIQSWNVQKIILFFAWIILLPYTIYSIAEIRHIAEICRLPDGNLYTQQCLNESWTLVPTFIYALSGSLIFVFSVIQVSKNILKKSLQKQMFIIGICFLSALATTYGLYSRVNIWDTVIRPVESMNKFVSTIAQPGFLLNTLMFAVFFVAITFLVNRFLRNAWKWY